MKIVLGWVAALLAAIVTGVAIEPGLVVPAQVSAASLLKMIGCSDIVAISPPPAITSLALCEGNGPWFQHFHLDAAVSSTTIPSELATWCNVLLPPNRDYQSAIEMLAGPNWAIYASATVTPDSFASAFFATPSGGLLAGRVMSGTC